MSALADTNCHNIENLCRRHGPIWPKLERHSVSSATCRDMSATFPAKLLSSSMRQASFKCETPRLELKSSRSFLAIKRCQQTKIGKVIKLARSSKKSGRISATLAVKLLKSLGLINCENPCLTSKKDIAYGW